MKTISNLQAIVDLFKPGHSIVLHSALAEPAQLGQQLADLAPAMSDVALYNLMPMGAAAYAQPASAEYLKVHTFLPGAGLRSAVNEARAQQHAVRLYEIPLLYERNEIQVDFLFLQTSLPDAQGNVSLGLSVDSMHSVLKQNPIVVAEFNPQMPVTHGDTTLPVEQIDYAIAVDYQPQTMPTGKADDVDQQVANNVVQLLENGMVLQYGIGTIPELVPVKVGHLQNLSIHTGLITDSIMAALQTGAYDNSGQADHKGRVVTTMAGGSADFYRYLNNNPQVVFKPTLYTHNANVLQRINKLVAINSVLQIDLNGNANAERAGGRIISGPGGLLDFARGASLSGGGISILAIRSTTRRGDVSTIVRQLPADAPVTITVDHVDYVVTEYGIAAVRGKTGTALVNELRAISHPDFRAQLC